MVIASSISGLPIYAPSAAFAPTNSAEVSAIASAYQVVSATATQLYAGTAYVTSINEAPVSAARAGNAANASLANSAWYDGTGRFISALPDSAAVSAIASSYVESGVSSKQDTLSFAYNTADQISSINGSALGGMDEAAVSGIASAYAESAVSSVSGNYYTTANESGFLTAQVQASWSESASASPSYIQDKPDLVDIVAGPGIVVDNPDGNTLRVSMADDYETVLWSGTLNTLNSNIECSENLSNFSTIKIFYRFVADSVVQSVGVHEFEPSEMSSGQNVSFGGFYLISNNFYGWWIGRLVVTDGYKVKITNTKNSWGTGSSPTDGTTNYSTVGFIYKIVGIHRIANN